MPFNLTGHHLDITPALRDYVKDKLARLERHGAVFTTVHVILSVDKLRQKAEATLHMSTGDMHADAIADDMYAAIDALLDKLDRQLKKLHEKRNDHHRSENTLKHSS
jgi:putative sigma-54 modulation protein